MNDPGESGDPAKSPPTAMHVDEESTVATTASVVTAGSNSNPSNSSSSSNNTPRQQPHPIPKRVQSDDDDDDEDNEEEEDDYDDFNYYYSFHDEDAADAVSSAGGRSEGIGGGLNNNDDPEFMSHQCLNWADTDKFLNEAVQKVMATGIQATESEIKLHLYRVRWQSGEAASSLQQSRLKRSSASSRGVASSSCCNELGTAFPPPSPTSSGYLFCQVCATNQTSASFAALPCGHGFCEKCWECYFDSQVKQGCSTGISCMSPNCDEAASESFVTRYLNISASRHRYTVLAFQEYVRSHPQLKLCPGHNSAAYRAETAERGAPSSPPPHPSKTESTVGPDGSCRTVIKVDRDKPAAKRIVCSNCKTSFCFKCGGDYHAPTDCDTIRLWLTKCADDSETANYISAHTKDCPKCSICIEKNGGCNHMQCYNCKHDFCWMCLGDWKSHGSEYYECSRYKENPNIAHESAHAQAREALKKYLHYFERWENHSKSMKLEAQTLDKIRNRITEKVMEGSGTWIDWQYLLDASSLLAKCRYTLQYTYPYAYYMEPSPRKELFEYQQAQLEAEIENLSWKIEHAESTDRGDLENQIDIAEKRRTSLLKDFLPTS